MRVRLHGGAVVLEYAGDPEWAAIAATELLRDIAGPHTHVTIKNVETRKGDQFAAHELLDAEEGFKLFAKLCGADSVRKLALRRLHADLLEHPAKAVDRLVTRRAQVPTVPDDEEEEPDYYTAEEAAKRLVAEPSDAVRFLQWYQKIVVWSRNPDEYRGYEFVDDTGYYVVGKDFEIHSLEDAPTWAAFAVEELEKSGHENPAGEFLRDMDNQREQQRHYRG